MLPEDWTPSQQTWRWLRERNVAESEGIAILESFTLYWRGSGGLKLDWDSAFRHWVTKEKKTAFRAGGPTQLALKPTADTSCCWTNGNTEPRCGEPGSVHYGSGRYLCSRHAGEYSKLNAGREARKAHAR